MNPWEWSDMSPDRFRKNLSAVLAANPVPPAPHGKLERLAWARQWSSVLYDNNIAGPAWPRQYGGMDLPFPLQVAYNEILAEIRAPGIPGGVSLVGPTIYKHGSVDQRERYLRPMLRADEIWAQGFSEPEAGSDLAALRTTARHDGGDYVVTGQKVWNSSADVADMLFALVRTGPSGSRDKGISYLLIDTSSPGVTIRPLRDITGNQVFCEIFLDDVRVPISNRVGAENDGWAIARTTLGHERAAGALNQATFYRNLLDEVIALARSRGLGENSSTVQRLAEFWSDVHVMRIIAMRIIADVIEHGEPDAGASVSRLIITRFEQELHEFALDMLGEDGLFDRGADEAIESGRWLYGFLRTRASTIGAGTSEIQHNVIAERILGMPRLSRQEQ